MAVQLEFFLEEKTFEESIQEEFNSVKLTCDKVRKSNFASIGELKKKIVDLNERLAIIERNICRGGESGISENKQSLEAGRMVF